MRTSTFRLSTSQQIIFAIVLTLAFTFAGCDVADTPIGGTIPTLEQPDILGNWVGLSVQSPDPGTPQKTLEIGETVGVYRVQDTQGECSGNTKLTKVFNITHIGENSLDIRILEHKVCGELQESGTRESVFYSLYANNLRIFDEYFVRTGAAL